MHTEISVTGQQTTKKQALARSILFSSFGLMRNASLSVVDHEQNRHQFGDLSSDLHAEVIVRHPDFYQRMLAGGSIGAAEAYIDGWWDTPNLTNVIRYFARHLSLLDNIERRVGWITQYAKKLSHWRNRNSSAQARQNIAAHYDLGNPLYRCFLDSNMLYSSGIYLSKQDSLEQAQIQKMDRLCRQLKLSKHDHLLEIGTGWGALAIYAAKNYGCKVTTTTISQEQYLWAKDLIKQEQLEGQITLIQQDYRELGGQFDKIVSVEMVEAVGKDYLPTFIKQCDKLLKQGGVMALQAITIADQRYASYSNSVDFIQKYIFPGGFLPSITTLLGEYTKSSSFIVRDIKDIGLDYAKTLHDWHLRFNDKKEELDKLGYDDTFQRMWRYYFCYSQGGFEERSISAVQILFSKPQY